MCMLEPPSRSWQGRDECAKHREVATTRSQWDGPTDRHSDSDPGPLRICRGPRASGVGGATSGRISRSGWKRWIGIACVALWDGRRRASRRQQAVRRLARHPHGHVHTATAATHESRPACPTDSRDSHSCRSRRLQSMHPEPDPNLRLHMRQLTTRAP
jgi:hypothetical protein